MSDLTAGKLIEMLSVYPNDMLVTNQENLPFIHIVNRSNNCITLSTEKPIGFCIKCGDYAYQELRRDVDYPGQCPTCDENLYSFEIENFKE